MSTKAEKIEAQNIAFNNLAKRGKICPSHRSGGVDATLRGERGVHQTARKDARRHVAGCANGALEKTEGLK